MSDNKDFVIEDGVLKGYLGKANEIVIPEGVVKIGSSAFENNRKIKKLIISGHVKEIGYQAFKGLNNLTELVISEGVEIIESKAFSFCTKLTEVTIPTSVKTVYGAFDDCKSLLYVHVSTKGIIEQVLRWLSPALAAQLCYGYLSCEDKNDDWSKPCSSRKKRILQRIIKDDNAKAMSKLYSISKKTVALGDIDEHLVLCAEKPALTAFLLEYKSCHYTLNDVEEKEQDAFEKEIEMKERTLKEWREIFKLSINKDKNTADIVGYKGTETDIVIPKMIDKYSVAEIGASAFTHNETLKSIVVPEGVTVISWWAFEGCVNLEGISIPSTLKEIGMDAFSGCIKIKSICLTELVKSIGNSAFYNCPNLTIHAPAGSYAEQYAKENNIPFIAEG